jgi:predicted  nucleic acid-binding Zn-ribbon protein
MADNSSDPSKKAQPPLPSSGMTGRLKSPTTKLPPPQAGSTGKVVVMLSSVAKPTNSQKILPPPVIPGGTPVVTGPTATPPKIAPPLISTGSDIVNQPPPFAAKKPMPVAKPLPPEQRLSTTTFVKLPPKTSAPAFVSLVPKPTVVTEKAEAAKIAPPLLPAKRSEPVKPPELPKSEKKKTGIIKLNTAALEKPTVAKVDPSIFDEIPEPAAPPVPEGWTKLHTGELPLPPGGLKDPVAAKASKPPPLPTAAVTAPPLAAEPAASNAKSEPVLNPAPVELPSAHPVHLAPPLVEKAHEESADKLPPPHLPDSASSSEPPKVAELKSAAPAPAQPAKPAAVTSPAPSAKADDKDKLKGSAPIMLTTTTRIPIPGVGEAKPALRPAVLPSRLRSTPEKPADDSANSSPQPAPENTDSKVVLPVNQPLTEAETTASAAKVGLGDVAAAGVAATAAAAATVASIVEKKKTPALPPTRAERAKKRRYRGVIVFWVLMPIVAVLLFLGILYFGRDTRVEGQVIPPPGMSVADEVWIVSDFSSLASGVADDVAKERVPLQLAIQEAQDHVQRVQADIASREERIHLIQDNIQAAKDEVNNVVKKSQADAQAIYDNEGRELDDEYNSKMAALKDAIASRAASLKLPYQPDPAFPSPEVWANAYRLALYQTPPGVDGVKEHQWIADQMKAWRDFEKSMDDRYQQMREQAASLKQANGPKIADLNAKMDDLQGRIQSTEAEEDPLKAELTQAQKDLADAQAAEAGLDDKYYGQLDALPAENISYRIPLQPNGRFTWIPDNPFGDGEVEHHYLAFSRAIRADGRQYWSLHEFTMRKNETTEITFEPGGYESTKQILRPNLSPEEIEQ